MPPMTPTSPPSPHPAISGREDGMGALTDEVRRLIELSVTCDLPHGEAEAAAPKAEKTEKKK